ncbi:MAG: hypothetical protein AAFV45_06340 [Pseudomonadota bacterium]
MAVDKATWAAIRRAYENGGGTVDALAKAHGVGVSTVYRRVKLDGWARRAKRPVAGPDAADGGEVAAVAEVVAAQLDGSQLVQTVRKVRSPAGKTALVRRLFTAIDTKLARIEDRMQSKAELSFADSERETRELSNMIRSFEKVTAVAADLEKQRGKAGKPGKGGKANSVERAADAERMRSEIAERLEKLFAGRTTK